MVPIPESILIFNDINYIKNTFNKENINLPFDNTNVTPVFFFNCDLERKKFEEILIYLLSININFIWISDTKKKSNLWNSYFKKFCKSKSDNLIKLLINYQDYYKITNLDQKIKFLEIYCLNYNHLVPSIEIIKLLIYPNIKYLEINTLHNILFNLYSFEIIKLEILIFFLNFPVKNKDNVIFDYALTDKNTNILKKFYSLLFLCHQGQFNQDIIKIISNLIFY